MDILPFYRDFGEPTKQITRGGGTMALWFRNPVTLTHLEGYIAVEIALEMDQHYKEIFPIVEHVVTLHDWSKVAGYDAECRKIVQLITHYVRPKRRELLLHLGPASGIVQIAVRTAAETISKLKRTPIEIFSADDAFESRAKEVLQRYFGHEEKSVPAR